MEEVTAKRERESEEDANERQAKELRESDEVKAMEVVYTMMSAEDRKKMGSRQFSKMPKEWQKAIARTSPGVLMKMARTSKLFAQLAREETTWQYMFQRDFPREWKFCQGQLPFFVLRPGHPFYREGFVPPEDETAWKRFYLHTANDYRLFCKEFYKLYKGDFKRHGNVPTIDLEIASAAEIQAWVHRVPLNMHFLTFDYRSALAWKFVQVMATLVMAAPNLDVRATPELCIIYARYALSHPDRHWLLPYLAYSHPFGLSTDDADFDYLLGLPRGSPGGLGDEYGEITASITVDLSDLHDDDVLEAWKTWRWDPLRAPFPSSAGVSLFSKTDEAQLQALLGGAVIDIEQTPGFAGHSEDEVFEIQTMVWRSWSVLQHCYKNPCLYSLPALKSWKSYTKHAYMIDNSETVQNLCEILIGNDPLSLHLPPSLTHHLFPKFDDTQYFVDFCSLFLFTDVLNDNFFPPGYRAIIRLFRKYQRNPRRDSMDEHQPLIYLETCIQCGAIPQISYQCGGTCNSDAIYCNQNCQRAHWVAGHSRECQKK